MRFFARAIFFVSVIYVGLSLAGCSPMSGAADDEKEPHFVLGKNRINAMDYSGAVEAFQDALEVNPRSAPAHFQLACLYDTKISDPAAAIYHYQQFLRFNPKTENADIIRQRINICKQQLASDVLQLPSASAAQQQVEKLAAQNRQLQSQVDHLNEVVKQWSAYYASQQEKTNSVSQNNFVAPDSHQTPDDVSSQQSQSKIRTPAIVKRSHVVKRGETFASIARKFGVSVAAIQAANPGVNAKKLKVNQIVNLPSP